MSETQSTFRPASDKQIAFVISLSRSRGLPTDVDAITAWAHEAGSTTVSAKITDLKEMPSVVKPAATSAPKADIPEGRYAIQDDGIWKFYKVDRPTEGKWAGYTFVKVQASDEQWLLRNRDARDAVLAAIEAAGPLEASKAYGRELGKCGMCGRTLTDPDSIENGIGPICAQAF